MAIRVEQRIDQVAQQTLARAVDHLLSLQAPAGWWKGELETNVTMDAEDLLLRKFLGVLTERTAAEISTAFIQYSRKAACVIGSPRASVPSIASAYADLVLRVGIGTQRQKMPRIVQIGAKSHRRGLTEW